MKEVKAYVRVRIVEKVVSALEDAGFCCMTVIDVSALGHLADAQDAKYSIEFVEKHSKMAKIELVCKNENVDAVVKVIREAGCTHQPGDGIIFVAPVEQAVKIRTGEAGKGILHV